MARTTVRWFGRLRALVLACRPTRRARSAVRPAAAALPAAADRVSAVRRQIAGRFSAVGDRMTDVSELCAALLRETEQLLDSTGDGHGLCGSCRETARSLGSSLAHVEHAHGKFAVAREHLERSDLRIAAILRQQSEWSGVVAPLKHIRTLCRIEAALLPSEMQTMFLALTAEIEQLEAKVGTMFAERFALLRTMHATLRELGRHLGVVIPAQFEQSRAKRARIDRTLRDVEARLAGRTRRDAALAAAARAIAEAVSRLVVGLQGDDIVAQKSAHLGEALEEMIAAAAAPAPAPAALALLHRLARIQAAQLDGILSDLAAAEAAVTGGFTGILADVARLAPDESPGDKPSAPAPAGDDPVEELIDALETTRELVLAVVREATAGFARIGPLGETTLALTGAMSELSVSMHLIALNAQILAIRHGTGTGLEVLAARMAEVSRGVSDVSTQALRALDELAGHVRATVAEFAALSADGERHAAAMAAGWRDRAAALRAQRDRGLRLAGGIRERSDRIAALSRRIVAEFRVHEVGRAGLADVHAALAAVAAATAPFAAAAPAASSSHARRYTMESERAIHAAVAAGAPARPTTPPAVAPDAHVELF